MSDEAKERRLSETMAEVERLQAAGDKKGAATVATLYALGEKARAQRESKPWRGNRRTGVAGQDFRWSKREDYHPDSPAKFLFSNTMQKLEFIAGQRGRDEAIRWEREFWLPRLEEWLGDVDREYTGKATLAVRKGLVREIARLRRCLGLTQSPDEVRAKTRERVRRLRAARKA